jgi:hypothetical protein
VNDKDQIILENLYEDYIWNGDWNALDAVLALFKKMKFWIRNPKLVLKFIRKHGYEFALFLNFFVAIHNAGMLHQFYLDHPKIAERHAKWTEEKVQKYSFELAQWVSENAENFTKILK